MALKVLDVIVWATFVPFSIAVLLTTLLLPRFAQRFPAHSVIECLSASATMLGVAGLFFGIHIGQWMMRQQLRELRESAQGAPEAAA